MQLCGVGPLHCCCKLSIGLQDLDEGNVEASLEQYCQDIQDTAAWGGQTELTALAHVLQHHIRVYAAGLPVVDMGQQYQGEHRRPFVEKKSLCH